MIDAAIPLAVTPVNVGQALSQAGNIVGQQQTQQLNGLRIQDAGLTLAQNQQNAQDEADVRAATAAATDPQTGQLDRGAQLSTLAKLNPTKAQQLATSYATQDTATAEAKAKLTTAQLAAATATNDAMDKVLQGVNDQASYTNALQHAQSLGINVSQFPQQYDPQIVARAHQQVLSTQQVLAQQNEQATQAETARHDQAMEVHTLEHVPLQGPSGPMMGNFDPKKGTYTDTAGNVIANPKPIPSPNMMVMGNQLGGTQNSAALDFAANAYRQTLQMPAGMSRSPGTVAAIIARAAQLDQQDGGIGGAGNKALLAASSKSLDSLQKNYDQVQAFEQTAEKNMNLLQQTAQKIPDLGARFANIPVRSITSSMLGTQNMAAFNTALSVAQTEAAKVLTSSNASGGVLSDSARHDMQDIVDGNMPLPAMIASLNTLKQDMANRTQAYQSQIGDIQNRIKAAGTPGAGNEGGTTYKQTATGPGGHKIGSNDGGTTWVDVQTGRPVQ
jgi:hypothetical protein